jgi:hypothetical protein
MLAAWTQSLPLYFEHNEVTIFGGQRDTAQASFQLGGCSGGLGDYLTGMLQQSNLGFSSAGLSA